MNLDVVSAFKVLLGVGVEFYVGVAVGCGISYIILTKTIIKFYIEQLEVEREKTNAAIDKESINCQEKMDILKHQIATLETRINQLENS